MGPAFFPGVFSFGVAAGRFMSFSGRGSACPRFQEKVFVGPFDGYLEFEFFLYPFEVGGKILTRQRNRFPQCSHAGGASDAVDIILRVLRQVVIDDVSDVFDMEAA